MCISLIDRFRRPIAAGIIVPLLLWCVNASADVKTENPQDELKVSIRSVQVNPDHILITYSLSAPANGSYEVSLVLLKEGSSTFSVPVRTATGDLGEGAFAGDARQVKWSYARDYPAGLAGDGFYFEITVNRATKSNLLWYLGIGGVVVAGGAAAVLLGGKKSDEPGVTAVSPLPFPPGRPNQ